MAVTMAVPMRELVELATSPRLQSEDWGYIMDVVDAINTRQNGPQDALNCIVERLQYTGERVQTFALTLLDACVANCGPRFHAVIGRFKFLNELIKLVSNKYYTETPEPVKRRILGMIQDWKNTLNQSKITEAYDMLKRQGHDFPIDAVSDSVPLNDRNFLKKEVKRRDSFDENEKKQMLQVLLQSKDPNDLAAANALIKEMVKEDDLIDDEGNEKIRRDLDVAENNIKLFREMLENWNPDDGSLEKNDLVQELREMLTKMRPRLARLIGDMDEDEDADGLIPINRDLVRALHLYDDLVHGDVEPMGQPARSPVPGGRADADDDLLLLDLDDTPSSGPQAAAHQGGAPVQQQQKNLWDDDLLALGLGGMDSAPAVTTAAPAYGAPQPYGGMATTMPMSVPAAAPMANNLLGSPAVSHSPAFGAAPMARSPQATGDLLGDLAGLSLGGASPTPQISSPNGRSVSPGLSAVMTAETFRPTSDAPIAAFDKDGIRVLMAVASNPPNPNTMALMVSFMNQNPTPVTQFEFLAAVPKSMKVKMSPPSKTSMPAFDIMRGPTLVSQILMVSNPTKAAVKIRYRFSYTLNGQQKTEQGDVSGFPAM